MNDIDWKFWNEYVYGVDEKPTFFVHRWVDKKWLKVELHLFVGTDKANCFHTHPAWAIRIGLRGGYIEEVHKKGLAVFRALDIGIVRPDTCHRVHALLGNRYAVTLWIRGPKVARTQLVGRGWRPWQRRPR